jgi:hypothetical protein
MALNHENVMEVLGDLDLYIVDLATGDSDASKNFRNASVRHYDLMISSINSKHGKNFRPFNHTPKCEFANETPYKKFATYLVDEANSVITPRDFSAARDLDEDGEHIKWRSAIGYFSGFVQAVLRKRAETPLSTEQELFFKDLKVGAPFITEQRREMKKRMIRHCIVQGIPVIVKPKGAERGGIIRGCRALYILRKFNIYRYLTRVC